MEEKRNFAAKGARKEIITIIRLGDKELLSIAVGLERKDKSWMIAGLPDDSGDVVTFVSVLSAYELMWGMVLDTMIHCSFPALTVVLSVP